MALTPQLALAFLTQQASFIEPQVYRTRYPAIRYPDLVPVDTTANEWTRTVTYYSSDSSGRAEWFNGNAQDVPRANVNRAQFETGVSMAAIGYGYDLAELGHAQLLNINLTTDKADAARRAAEEFVDQIAIFGDSAKGFRGLANAAGVASGPAPADGTGGASEWATKRPAQVLRDFNGALTQVYAGSARVEMADTVLLPHDVMTNLGATMLSDTSDTSILRWLEANNTYTLQTRRPLTIMGVFGLETAGAGGTARMVAYRKNPSVVKMHYPMPFRFFPAWQTGPIRFDVPGIFRLGGVDVKLPFAFRYLDAI